MEKKKIENIHPLTIINDRYGGCYSGDLALHIKLEIFVWEKISFIFMCILITPLMMD